MSSHSWSSLFMVSDCLGGFSPFDTVLEHLCYLSLFLGNSRQLMQSESAFSQSELSSFTHKAMAERDLLSPKILLGDVLVG